MNERDAGFWVDVLNGLKNAWPQILGSMMAGIICYGRLIYDGEERKNSWIEGILCGALTVCISSALDVVGLPISLSPFIGGMVGCMGVDKIRSIAISAISKRVGVSDEDQQ